MGLLGAAVLLAPLVGVAVGQDVGYENMWKSALDELSSFCVKAPGPIPSWALGDFIMPGIGQYEMGQTRLVDALDGFGKLHRFELREGEVCATYRMMNTEFYNNSKKENTVAPGLLFFETDPPRHCPFYNPVCNMFAQSDNNYVNTIKHGGKLLSITDSPYLLEVDPKSLSIIGKYKFDDNLQGKICYASSAHPHHHPRTGDWVDFLGNADVLSRATVRLFHMSESEPRNRKSLVDIPMDTAPYMHSFGMSEKYVVLPRMPIELDMISVLTKPLSKTFKELDITSHDTSNNAFYVVPLDGGATKVRKLPVDQRLYYTHVVNTYENATGIVIDLVTQAFNFFAVSMMIDDLIDKASRDEKIGSPRPVVKRFVLPFADDMPVTTEIISDSAVMTEFPKMNPKYKGYKHCFYWSLQWFTDGKTLASQAISKYDLCHGGTKRQWYRPNWYPSEASFVPSADEHAAEDAGLLLFTAFHGVEGNSYLMVVNASTMETMSEVGPFPRIGFTTHGEFYPAGTFPGASALHLVV